MKAQTVNGFIGVSLLTFVIKNSLSSLSLFIDETFSTSFTSMLAYHDDVNEAISLFA